MSLSANDKRVCGKESYCKVFHPVTELIIFYYFLTSTVVMFSFGNLIFGRGLGTPGLWHLTDS